MIKFTSENMDTSLAELLLPNEKSVCPIYCAFRERKFFGSNIQYGYFTCTDTERLLIVRYDGIIFENRLMGTASLSAIKGLKIKKSIIGQYNITITFATEKKDFTLMLQISPKVAGGGFNYQEENLQKLLKILEPYQTVKGKR